MSFLGPQTRAPRGARDAMARKRNTCGTSVRSHPLARDRAFCAAIYTVLGWAFEQLCAVRSRLKNNMCVFYQSICNFYIPAKPSPH